MKAVFNSEFGVITCEGGFNTPSLAYFTLADYEASIDTDGYFTGPHGERFQIMWPIPHMRNSPDATLHVQRWATIGRTMPTSD